MSKQPYIYLDDQVTPSVRRYNAPVDIIEAHRIEEVGTAFEAIRTYQEQGYYIAGYASYELGYALEPKLHDLMPSQRHLPLLQFGVFRSYESTPFAEIGGTGVSLDLEMLPSLSEAEYRQRFNSVIEYIRSGDVYQINLTFSLKGTYSGSPIELYQALRHRQPGRYGGIISLAGPDIISLSPELFFKTGGVDIQMRPMKGTARRQADPVQDAALRDAMQIDPKSRAENLMIVDLLRNDVSRIAEPGSVKVPELFTLETYPTLHQMTSLVKARMREDITIQDIFKSMFPCGSITGAPKIRAMEIIRELEDEPRGAYCGAIGYIDPNGESCFNVAIRTLILEDGRLTYNVGGGLVLDSQACDEYDEALLKAKVLATSGPDLIETLRWVRGEGALRFARHEARMARSARALGYPFPATTFTELLNGITANTPQRVRLVLNSGGVLSLEMCDFEPVIGKWQVSMSANPLTEKVQETRYKVSERHFYDGERRRVSAVTGCDEVLFVNETGELCEGSFTSLFVEVNGEMLTPSLSSGLLPGILREELLEQGEVREAKIKPDDLMNADRIYVGNSLRGLIEVTLTDSRLY